MSVAYILGLLAVGLAAGFISSLAGIGGGIVMVPCLVLLFGMNQKMAQGTTLSVLAMPVAFIGAYNYYKQGFVNWKVALLLATTFVIGGYLGSKTVLAIDTYYVKKIFAILLIAIAVKYLFFDK